jgi:hypothetical protein
LFPLIFWPTPGSTGLIYWWLIGGNWRKVPFEYQHHRSSNMAAMAAILHLVSVNYLMNACVNWSDFLVAHWGSSIFTMFHFFLSLIFHIPTDNVPLVGIWHALHCPCFLCVFPLGSTNH